MEKLSGKDAVISMLDDPMDAAIMDAAPSLQIIANYAVGYNNVDVSHAISKSIKVTHTPGVLTDATADIAFALLIAVARRIIPAHQLTLDEESAPPLHAAVVDLTCAWYIQKTKACLLRKNRVWG